MFFAIGFMNKALGQFAGGSGTEYDPYLISMPDQLVLINYHLNNTNVHFKLLNDIDLTSYLAPGGPGHNDGAGWLPIGNASNKFSGTFNGAGFKIIGLWINRSSAEDFGFFLFSEGNISNLGIEIASNGLCGRSGGGIAYSANSINNCYVTGNINGDGFVGGLVGKARGAISNSHTNVVVRSKGEYTGGLAGSCSSSITDCYVLGNVSANKNDNVGGLVGYCNHSAICNCYVIGNVGGNDFVGGLIGYVSGSVIFNCFVKCSVEGNDCVGGLFGIARNDEKSINVTDCFAKGNVKGISNVGGITGQLFCDASNQYNGTNIRVSKCYAMCDMQGIKNIGGLTGSLYQSSGYYSSFNINISQCFAIGNITGIEYIGGLCGYSERLFSPWGGPTAQTINNCYTAFGTISGEKYVGGLLGGGSMGPTITSCYATSSVSGNTNVGGLIGDNDGTVNNCFFDYETTGQIYGIGSGGAGCAVGKSTAEMQTKSTYTNVGWDFETIWDINSRGGYPFLRNISDVGINEPVQNRSVQFFPNPAQSEIFINSDFQIEKVEVYSITGTLLIVDNNYKWKISISELAQGVYFLKVYTNEYIYVNKFVKK